MSLDPSTGRWNSLAGREIHERNAAHRTIDDPVKLARAARIIRAGLGGKITPSIGELTRMADAPDVQVGDLFAGRGAK